MKILERNLIEYATAYVEDGILKKWRYYSNNPNDIEHVLHYKQREGKRLTEKEMEYLELLDNVIFVSGNVVRFNKFSGYALLDNRER